MNTEHLRYFLAVAHCGSISKAANELHFKQQYLSNIIKNLENQVGLTFFLRKSRGVELTEDGQFFLEQATKALKIIDQLSHTYLYPSQIAQRSAHDRITLYIVPSISSGSLANVLPYFQELFPNTTVNIVEQTRAKILESVKNDASSCGISLFAGDEPQTDSSATSSLIYKSLASIHFVAITRRNNPNLRGRNTMTLEEIIHEPLIAYAPKGLEYSVFQRLLNSNEKLDIRYVVENFPLFVSLLAQNNYFSIVNKNAALGDNFITLPINDIASIQAVLIVQEAALKQYSLRSFINQILLIYNQPPLKYSDN